MAGRIHLRLRRLLPLPLSFRLSQHLDKIVQAFFGEYFASWTSNTRHEAATLHPTSYINGLRGLAALIICVSYYTEVNHPSLTSWWNVSPRLPVVPEGSWIQLPFVRVLFSGRPMMHMLFVISGFALSVNPLAAARARDFARCRSALASAALRRPVRLCGPPIVSMALIILFIRASWLWGALPTLRRQLDRWIVAVDYRAIWPWSRDTRPYPLYNGNLWAIPIQLCHSLLVLITVLASSRMRSAARIALSLVSVMYYLYSGKWAAAEFTEGMVLAEAHLASAGRESHESLPLVNSPLYPSSLEEKEPKRSQGEKRSSRLNVIENILNTAVLTAALFIFGWPNTASSRTPGIRHLAYLVPEAYDPRNAQDSQKFWFAIAAMGAVWSCGRLAFVRETILESRFAQYAGRISYAVCIVHGPVLSLFQDAVLGVAARPERWGAVKGSGLRGWIGIDTAFHRTLCWATGLAVLLPLVLVTAHFFCRFVDEPLKQLAKKIKI